MAQRPRLGQLKRNDINYRTFQQQYEELEGNTKHFRTPVRSKGELPFGGNIDGTQCLVIDEGVMYYWDANLQNWQPILGQVFNMETATFKRWKKTFIATANQTDFLTDVLFEVGKSEVDVYVQGLLQDIGIDYIEFDDRTIRFPKGLPSGAVVTIATPMIVESLTSLETYLKRLEDLEFNNYQMMMIQYYDGKGFEAQGMVFDGFINTEYIDYALTTSNVLYDAVRKSMYMFHATDSNIIEQFDSTDNIDPSSTVYIRGSEITLPISASIKDVFNDDFSTQNFMDIEESSIFWDREKQLVTNDDTYGGGSYYYKGDFMSGTGNADAISWAEDPYVKNYYSSAREETSTYIANNIQCYSVLSMGSMNIVINAVSALYRGPWPYDGWAYLYKSNNALQIRPHNVGGYGLFPDGSGSYVNKTVYVHAWNNVVSLRQDAEVSGRYHQRLTIGTGRVRAISWGYGVRPTGLPNTMFGSQNEEFTNSSTYISQIGSTMDHLLIRAGNVLYFLDRSLKVVKTLDWTKASRKPSTYNVVSQQMTADKRYLYFPARLLRDGIWGYYLEVFAIEDGSFVGEILVTTDNSGNPGTTAMAFDHTYNRLILGQQGNNRYSLHGKDRNPIQEKYNIAGMLIFEAPDEMSRELISKPFVTNLPQVHYKLSATQTLNAGTIDYYIRFNDEAWTKINLNTGYLWNNPGGAKETIVQLRAVLKTTLTATLPPILNDWTLSIRPFETAASYRSKEALLNMDGVTGGSLRPSQDVPNETHIQWFVELDSEDNRYYAGKDGTFNFPEVTGDSLFTMEANMATSNILMSPVVRDVKLQLFRDDEGALYTETSRQLHDIQETSIWVTTSAGNSNYEVNVSRDDGVTWFKARKKDSIQVTNGNVETNWYHDFDDVANGERAFKIRFRINGSTEILQYGAKIN